MELEKVRRDFGRNARDEIVARIDDQSDGFDFARQFAAQGSPLDRT